MSLQAVISQILLPRLGPDRRVCGRVAAFEIMLATPSVRSRIRDNKTFQIRSDIQTGAKFGMVTLDSCLMEHYRKGRISREELLTKAQDPDEVFTKLNEEGRR